MRLKSFNLLNALSIRIKTLVKGERLFPVAAIWNNWLGSVLVQFFAQIGAVISRVAEHALR